MQCLVCKIRYTLDSPCGEHAAGGKITLNGQQKCVLCGGVVAAFDRERILGALDNTIEIESKRLDRLGCMHNLRCGILDGSITSYMNAHRTLNDPKPYNSKPEIIVLPTENPDSVEYAKMQKPPRLLLSVGLCLTFALAFAAIAKK